MVDAVQRRTAPRRLERAAGATKSWTRMALVYLFVIALILPTETSIFIGPMRLSPYRIVLFVALLPCLYRLLSGRAGGLKGIDVLMLLHGAWAVVALFVIHGMPAWEFGGIYVVEALGAYFLARCYIRSADDFEAFIRFVLTIVLILVPIVAFESITGNHLLRDPVNPPDPRLGLDRAYGPFEHPILFGVFCASMLGMAFYALKDRMSDKRRFFHTGTVAATTFFSLSSGPLTALVAQVLLMTWSRAARRFRRRWSILAGGYVAAWIVVDLISNRTPIHVFITYFTFNVGTAYNRILIWEYGTAEVARHPVFGIGLNDWVRPSWMSASMDNFWLVEAVRFGLPALVLLAAAILLLCFRIGRLQDLAPRIANCRMGWMITIIGLIIAGATVHYWNAIFCFFLFLVGCGGWLLWPEEEEAQVRSAPRAHSRPASRGAAPTPLPMSRPRPPR